MLITGLVSVGALAPAAESAPTSALRCRTATVPKPITSGQTNPAQMQVRWAAGAYVAKYRLNWSPAPYGNWPGYNPYTPWLGKAARLAAVNLPAVGSGDKFLNVNYGNPKFARLQVNNGCDRTVRQSPWVAVWPRGKTPANATNGEPLAVGTYNVELFPTTRTRPTKMTNLASNIAARKLDLVLLQEATYTTAKDMAAKLGSDWEVVGAGNDPYVNQQIIYRGSRFTEDVSGLFGQRDDNNASTPLPTPWARLMPVGAPAGQQGIFVVSVHLEESKSTNVLTKKAAARNSAVALLKAIATKNNSDPGRPVLPVVLGGDLKGNFQRYCDEKSSPACPPDGQPTFIRAGYYDAQAALTRVGVGYATVNKHVYAQPYNKSGYGGRADFLVFKGFPGVTRYENVKKGYGDGSATYQSDHNLVYANLFIPHKN